MATDKQISELLAKCQYKYKDQAKRDIQSALSYFKELNLTTEKYNYPDGLSKDLVTLKGTIPVNYKDIRYNIPVQLYLADTHPYLAPICYVRPTPDMSVNVSANVNSNGRIMLPFLNEWKPPQSDLYLLLNLMTMKFNEETPLFSKVSRPTPIAAASSSSSAAAQYQPQPQSQQTNSALPYPTQYNVNQPPYPISNMTPYPINNTQQNTPYPVTNNPYYPMPSMQQQQQQQQQQPSYLKSGSGNNLGQVRTSSSSYAMATPTGYSDETIKPEHFRMSLISAIQDKARMKYNEIDAIKQAEIECLKRVNQDLQEGEQSLNNLINEAEQETENLIDLTADLKRKQAQLNESINRIQHRDQANIEDAVVNPAPLYRQLLQLYSEDLAIQDLIYYLSEGLQRKTISLDIFLKQVRFLSRRQFMLRATMLKAREKAALPL